MPSAEGAGGSTHGAKAPKLPKINSFEGHCGKRVNELECMNPGATGRRWLSLFSSGIVAIYGILFIVFWNRMGPADHDQFLVFHELQLWNSSLFGLAKQWTPLLCSGVSLAGEPQVPFMSLSMALTYALGPLIGLKLATVIYFIAGWIGAYLYAGLWLKQPGQCVLAASLFIGNGFFFCRLGFGHIDFIPFLTLPLVLWALHQGVIWRQDFNRPPSLARLVVATLAMGAIVALAIDGSPVAIIHLMLWVGLYALVLAYTARSFVPIAMVACAAGIAAVLDAGYLWPMIEAQADFPRHTKDSFTSVLSLLWFAILPVRGKLLPANGNGHELSVFIGPVIAYLLWTYRPWLFAALPKTMKVPLVVVSVISIVLGMGSLKSLHIPMWLSPFDMLRPLLGFRSLGVTGRFWGFLALPLSVLGSAALWRFVSDSHEAGRWRSWLSAAFILQFAFQSETVLSQWLGTSTYRTVPVGNYFRGGPEKIEYVAIDKPHLQGDVITPTRAVLNCYDMDDFLRADATLGTNIVRATLRRSRPDTGGVSASGNFVSWNHVQLNAPTLQLHAGDDISRPSQRIHFVLNQAFNASWHTSGCDTLRGEHDNLIVDCPIERVRQGPIDVVFHNELSTRAAEVSLSAWRFWFVLAGGAMVALLLTHVELDIRWRAVHRPQ